MLKLVVSAVAVASTASTALGLPEHAFTLRDPGQMARHGNPGLDGAHLPPSHGDPKPIKPKPYPLSSPPVKQKPAPLVPGQHSRPGVHRHETRYLHHAEGEHHDHDEDHVHGDHRTDRHMPPPLAALNLPDQALAGLDDPPPLPDGDPRPTKPKPPAKMKPAPLAPGLLMRPGMGKIRSLRHGDDDHHDHHDEEDHDHHGHDDDHHHADRHKPPPPPALGRVFPPMMPPLDKPKPKPGAVGDMKPKPAPGMKPKPAPGAVGGMSSVSRAEVSDLAASAQQQCQLDYARMCAPGTSFFTQSNVMSFPFATMSPVANPLQSFFMDFFWVDEGQSQAMSQGAPCGVRAPAFDDDGDGDDDDKDDDYHINDDDDDESAEVVSVSMPQSSPLDILKALFFARDKTGDFSEPPLSQGSFRPFPGPMPPMTPRDLTRPSSSAVGFGPRMSAMPPRMLREEDEEERVVLGFGQDGDMCLVDNFPRLSASCQQAVTDLHEAVVALDMEDEDRCHMLPLLMIVLLLGLALRCATRRRMQQRLDSLQTTLAAIHASPDLRAKVEAASGVPLPPLLPTHKCCLAQKPWYVKVLCLLGVFAVSVFVVATSFLITGAIVSSVDSNNNNDDANNDMPPLAALAILFVVLTLEIVVVKKLRAVLCAYLEAPATAPATASTGTSPSPGSNANDDPGGASFPRIMQRIRSVQISSLLPARFRAASPSSGPQYVPLLTEDDYCCEQAGDRDCSGCSSHMMVPVQASAPPSSSIPVRVSAVVYTSPHVQSSISML